MMRSISFLCGSIPRLPHYFTFEGYIMKNLGKILTVLFPVFIARMVRLSELKDKAMVMKITYRFKQVGYKPSMKELERYYALINEFHDDKFWFMADLPSYGSNNKIF